MKRIIHFLTLFLCLAIVLTSTCLALQNESDSKYMVLVNRSHRVSADYVPSDLVTYEGSNYKLEKTCATALKKMITACRNAGLQTLVLYAGYRSYQTQYNKYYGKINSYMSQGYSREKATELTDLYYAPPGGSEHHTGLAADICTPSVVNQYGQLHESFGKTKEGIWLRNNCYKYGFILRYDEGKESITGYNYEPWHFRYVGVSVATEIYNKGLTFEEYIEIQSDVRQKVNKAPDITIKNQKIYFSAPSGTTIYYTTDGSLPTQKSQKYTAPLYKKDTTFTAVCCYGEYTSPAATVTVTQYGDIFTDIQKKNWYYKTVGVAVHKNLFNGTAPNTFSPDVAMSRAMFVKVFANLSGVNLNLYKNKVSFTDVSTKAWYSPAIAWAAESKVVTGLGDGTFAPEASVTREQACIIMANYCKLNGDYQPADSNHFTDRDKISRWAVSAVNFCAKRGIVNGTGNGEFEPQGTTTRAQAAQMLLNFISKQCK